MFKFIFHILGIIFFLIWITIGALLLVVVAKVNPAQLLSQASGAAGLLQGLGALPGLSQLSQAGAKGIYDSLPADKQACVKKAWGEETLAAVLAGQKPLSGDLVSKMIGCLPSK